MVVIALLRTGDAKAVSENAAILAALVALGGIFTTQLVNSALEDRRAQTAHNIEVERAQEAALQKYFEEIGKLMADTERPLLSSAPGDELSTLARAQTLTVLEGLDPRRKRILLQFLAESGLINRNGPVVSLRWANLRRTDLRGIDLRMTDLSRVDLSEAKIAGGSLLQTDLSGAILRQVDLREAFLTGTGLQQADLTDAKITKEQIEALEELRVIEPLKGTTMPDGSKHD
jgi:hypothetical protein